MIKSSLDDTDGKEDVWLSSFRSASVVAMQIDVVIHLEADEMGEVSWWAGSSALAGFTAIANTLSELRALIKEELAILGAEDGIEWTYGNEQLAAGPNEAVIRSASPNDTPAT